MSDPRQHVEFTVRSIIAQQKGIDMTSFRTVNKLRGRKINCDELDVVEIIGECEEAFGITFSGDTELTLCTPGDIIKEINKQLKEESHGDS